MTKTYTGIDVSKKTLDVVLLNGRDYYKVFENNEKGFRYMQKWLKKHNAPISHVCMEATGQYGFPAAEYLYSQGHQVSVVNPFRIKAYGRSCMVRNKTDKMDAYVIADFCKRHEPEVWAPPEPCYAELRALTRHLDSLMDMRQQEVNRQKSGITSTYVLTMIKEHIVQMDKNIKDIKKQIQDFINGQEQLKFLQELLVSIPSVAELTAARLLAEVQDVRRFESARQLAAYAGVTPRQFTSGTSVHGKSRMSKMGNVHLRKYLYMPAMVAKRHNPIIHEFCERLIERNKLPKVIIGAAMRKLLHIAYGVLKSEQPFDPNFLDKFAKKA